MNIKTLISQLSSLNQENEIVLTITTESGQVNTNQISVDVDDESGFVTIGGQEVDFENVN